MALKIQRSLLLLINVIECKIHRGTKLLLLPRVVAAAVVCDVSLNSTLTGFLAALVADLATTVFEIISIIALWVGDDAFLLEPLSLVLYKYKYIFTKSKAIALLIENYFFS
jgi:hypothetical protein